MPLIDILVVLLFFFIVMMNDRIEKTPRPEIQVSLPSANAIKSKVTTVQRSTLTIGADGQTELDGIKVISGLLKETLRSNLKVRPGLKLALSVDKNCPWERVLVCHSAAVEAGYPPGDIFYPVRKSTETPSTESSP